MTAAQQLTPAVQLTFAPVSSRVELVPFSSVRRSPLNPRKKFDAAALIELARNIYERTPRDERGTIIGSGVMQNLMGRPSVEGIEIAAGERRQRAVELLVQGLTIAVQSGQDANGRPVMTEQFIQVPGSYPLPFCIEPMTDAELIETATVENIQRQDMTPLEEADAYLALNAAGRSIDYIALRYGKHPGTVKGRIQLAAGLGQAGRKLLDAGDITLEHARIIASTSGALKRSLTEQARSGASLRTLHQLVKSGAFLVEHALFDVPGSGLQIEEGLIGDLPARFSDPKQALNKQLETLEAHKVELLASGWKTVLILPSEDPYARLPYQDWLESYRVPEAFRGTLVFVYSTVTGRVERYEHVARINNVRASQAEPGGTTATPRRLSRLSSPEQTGLGVRETAHRIGHETRCQALDGYLATHERACLVLAIERLWQDATHGRGELMGLKVTGRKESPLTPESLALSAWVQERFPALFTELDDGTRRPAPEVGVYDVLSAEDVTLGELVRVLASLTHRQVGAWESHTSRPSQALNGFAAKVELAGDLVNRFILTDAYLDAYRSTDLVALIGTMPAELRPAFKHGCPKKELKARILERSAALTAAGWLPELVKFQS
ncbi:ParB N-terminal domain-containing protein [Deinococcus sp.]|uniref:ParB/RepB/Spo0J family partition protein n=1 Tax=Deinococcus sp. TaxID=47478 RepID=UPI0025EA8534|nr:ParB N-terminal domain-containing protein [Deinococcus sp.]